MSSLDIQTVDKVQSRVSIAFRPLTVLLLCIIGLMSFGAYISLSGFQGDLEKRDYTARSHALSKSPNGFAGIYRLMRTENETVGGDLTLSRKDGVGSIVLDMQAGAREYFSFPDSAHEVDNFQSDGV